MIPDESKKLYLDRIDVLLDKLGDADSLRQPQHRATVVSETRRSRPTSARETGPCSAGEGCFSCDMMGPALARGSGRTKAQARAEPTGSEVENG